MFWWQWAVAGLVLVALEMLNPGGFYLVFFGLGALVVSALVGLDVVVTPWVQWLAFSVFSFAGLLFFRKPVLRWMKEHTPETKPVDPITGESAIVPDGLAPGAIGRVELRGTVWQARNATDQPIAAGTRCKVVKVDGLVVWIEPE